MTHRILSVNFAVEEDVFTVGTTNGFYVYDSFPLKERFHRGTMGGVKIVEILRKSNIVALVGGGDDPAYAPNKVVLWDDKQCQCIAEIEIEEEILNVKFSSEFLIIVSEYEVYIFKTSNLKLVDKFMTARNPRGLCTLGKRKIATLAVEQGHVSLLQFKGDKITSRSSIVAHDGPLACIKLSQDEKLLATASDKGTLIRIFETEPKLKKLMEFRRGTDYVDIHSITFSPDNKRLCVNSDKSSAHLFNLTPPEPTAASTSYFGLSSYIPKSVSSYMSDLRSTAKFDLPDHSYVCMSFCSDREILCLTTEGNYSKFGINHDNSEVKQKLAATFAE